jgi:polar amino acid transport system substrate-binding protein
MRWLFMPVFLTVTFLSSAFAQSTSPLDIASDGKLRVAMIGANPVLVSKAPDGSLRGISVDLGSFIAKNINATLVPVVYADPEAYTHSFGKHEWDIAIGPRRASEADKVDFSPDFMLVDNVYVAAPGKKFADASQVDNTGVRIAVAKDGAPDKFLSGHLKAATLVRVPGKIDAAVAILRSGDADVYGSNGQFTYAVAEKLPGATIVPGAFATIHMAVSIPKDRSAAAKRKLNALVDAAIAADLPRKVIAQEALKGVRPIAH